MKTSLLILFLSILAFKCLSGQQNSISSHANLGTYSLHYDLLFNRQIKQHKFGLGLKFNDGLNPRGPSGNNLHLHPQSFMEVFGIKLGYQYIIKTKLYIRPYVFLSSEYTKCSWQNEPILQTSNEYIINPKPDYSYYAAPGKLIAGPNKYFDERIGFGFYAPITDRIDFDIYGGAGWLFVQLGPPGPNSNAIIGTIGGSLTLNAGIGLSYKFGKKE